MKKEALVKELKSISEHVNYLHSHGSIEKPIEFTRAAARAHALIEEIFNERTPSHKTTMHRLGKVFGGKTGLISNTPEDIRCSTEQMYLSLHELLAIRGYLELNLILTTQEHALMGSQMWIEVVESPYLPVGLVKGVCSIDEIRTARQLEGTFGVQLGFYNFDEVKHSYLLNDLWVPANLEQLYPSGETIRDPRIVLTRGDDIQIIVPEIAKTEHFPFPRSIKE